MWIRSPRNAPESGITSTFTVQHASNNQLLGIRGATSCNFSWRGTLQCSCKGPNIYYADNIKSTSLDELLTYSTMYEAMYEAMNHLTLAECKDILHHHSIVAQSEFCKHGLSTQGRVGNILPWRTLQLPDWNGSRPLRSYFGLVPCSLSAVLSSASIFSWALQGGPINVVAVLFEQDW